jgi:hypothetical protein
MAALLKLAPPPAGDKSTRKAKPKPRRTKRAKAPVEVTTVRAHDLSTAYERGGT